MRATTETETGTGRAARQRAATPGVGGRPISQAAAG